eukprot:TRINITY_DN22964_c0_g1_i1.p1 TRINITY_DN22964_c0_g1~~TRINITY_DN22964_c0_g1_i1.p1  ORF type:complete len:374 (+),score=90.34 TRINITY_DN22964_c0_g1_i1:44-1165(+)
MYNRYTHLRLHGRELAKEEQEAEATKSRKRLERRRRHNSELATRATRRVEQWMLHEIEEAKPAKEGSGLGFGREPTNSFNYEHRSRDKSKELDSGPGSHAMTAGKYVPELARISATEDYMARSLRECREPYSPVKGGESPFRQRVSEREINPPIRFKAVTSTERLADAQRSQFAAWTDTGQDCTRVPQMGFDAIPVGMEKNAVCVRSKAKAPLLQQFKLNFHPGDLNPRGDEWEPQPYTDPIEPTGYGLSSKKNNSRIRVPHKEISSALYLSPVRGKSGQLAVLGELSSHHRDRKPKVGTDKGEKKAYFGGVKNIMTMNGSFQDEISEDIVASRELAAQVMSGRSAAREVGPKNGANIYAWNELFGFKDHVTA